MDQVPTDHAALQVIKKLEFPNRDEDDRHSINFVFPNLSEAIQEDI